MEQKELKVELRSATGKGIARRLRNEGLVPGVVYGKGIEAVPVTVGVKELEAAIAGEGGQNNLITLQTEGSLNGSVVIVVDMDRDPIRWAPRHVDFHKISLTEKIKVEVPVNVVGTAVGVRNGGLLDLALHSLHVECLPAQIPEHIDVAVADLQIGQSIHIGELKLPEGVKVIGDSRASVVSVLGRVKEEAPAATA